MTESQLDEFDLLETHELALNVLGRRLRDNPDDVKDSALATFIAHSAKLIEKQEEEAEEQRAFSVVEQTYRLPKDRALELLHSEEDRLREAITAVYKRIEDLEGGTND